MSAYIVIHNVITDPAKMQAYFPMAVETLAAHGAEILAAADATSFLEGNPPFPRTVILKFATPAAARGWHESPEYRQALQLRLQATEGYAVLVDGLDTSA